MKSSEKILKISLKKNEVEIENLLFLYKYGTSNYK